MLVEMLSGLRAPLPQIPQKIEHMFFFLINFITQFLIPKWFHYCDDFYFISHSTKLSFFNFEILSLDETVIRDYEERLKALEIERKLKETTQRENEELRMRVLELERLVKNANTDDTAVTWYEILRRWLVERFQICKADWLRGVMWYKILRRWNAQKIIGWEVLSPTKYVSD